MLSVPQTLINQFVRHILLGGKMSGIIMRILIPIVIAQFFHQLRRRIADRKGNRLVARLTHQCQGSINTQIGRVALGRRSQIDSFNGDKAGNEIQSPMAVVVLGGLLSSTVLNIFVMPLIYERYINRKKTQQTCKQ